MPDRENDPVYYRLDRMIEPRLSEKLGCAPDDWDIDAWLADSFGVWRDEKQDVVLRIHASAASRAREWRFHRNQQIEQLENGDLLIRFTSGGMRELAEHLFTWGNELIIEQPVALIEMMRQRIMAALTMLPPEAASPNTTIFVAPTMHG
ncbi:hypothetical protein SKA58_16908 [Sphingomonas sp. SKA58]|nr:hypothetical protein SKA58_16908 [Sphingomonas sp. SKA58]